MFADGWRQLWSLPSVRLVKCSCTWVWWALSGVYSLRGSVVLNQDVSSWVELLGMKRVWSIGSWVNPVVFCGFRSSIRVLIITMSFHTTILAWTSLIDRFFLWLWMHKNVLTHVNSIGVRNCWYSYIQCCVLRLNNVSRCMFPEYELMCSSN